MPGGNGSGRFVEAKGIKTLFAAAGFALLRAVPALAQNDHISVASNDDGTVSEDYVSTVIQVDPRPVNGRMPEAVAGAILGTSSPSSVLLTAG